MRSSTLLIAALTLAACRPTASDDPTELTADAGAVVEIETGDTFTLATGGSAEAPAAGLRLTFLDVEADSRCPTDVTCVWQGDAVVVVESADGRESREWRLHTAGEPTGPRAFEVADRTVELVDLAPAPHSEATIALADYRATFRLLP